MSFMEELMTRIDRSRNGFRAMAASIGLFAFGSDMKNQPWEARARLNDLHYGFAQALHFFPGGLSYRACFLGDSIWVVQELKPEDDINKQWSCFCGHIYALCTLQQEPELLIGNKGIRVIASYGQLLPITRPEDWQDDHLVNETQNWFVLTGANEAVAKCHEAELSGGKGGFLTGHFWHESIDMHQQFHGTEIINNITPEEYRQPALYPEFYRRMCSTTNLLTQLEFEPWPDNL